MRVSENADEKKLPMFVIAHVKRARKHVLQDRLLKWRPFDKQLGEVLLEIEEMVRQISAKSAYESKLARGFWVVPYTVLRKKHFSEVEREDITKYGITVCLCDGKCLICVEKDCLGVPSIMYLLHPEPHYKVILNPKVMGANIEEAKKNFEEFLCTKRSWVERERQLSNELYLHLTYGLDPREYKYVDCVGAILGEGKK